MSVQEYLAEARRLRREKRFLEAIAKYKAVLALDPVNSEALDALDLLTGQSDEQEQTQSRSRIKTDFFQHQAEELSVPMMQRAPVKVVLAIALIALLVGAYHAVMFVLNYDKIAAMRYVEVRLQKPYQKNGQAYINVELVNYNPAPIKDTTFKYTLSTAAGAKVADGELTVAGSVPAGDNRTYSDLPLGQIPGDAGRMHAELVNLSYGPKPALSAEVASKFIDACGLKDEDSVEAFTAIVRAAPEFAPGYIGLGQALAAIKDLEHAIKAFQKAVKLDPENANAHYRLGVALFYQKDSAGARKEFEEAARLDPGDPAVARSLQQWGSQLSGPTGESSNQADQSRP